MENSLIQAHESIQSGIKKFDKLERAVEALEALVGIQSRLVNLKSKNELTKLDGKIINTAIESLNFENSNKLCLEDITSDFTTDLSANKAINNIENEVRSLYEKIIDWVKDATSWLETTFNSFSEVYSGLGDLAIKINSMANGLQKTTPNNSIITDSDLVNFFYRAEFDSKENLPYDAQKIQTKYVEHIQLSSPLICVQFVDTLSKDLESINQNIKSDTGIDSLLKSINLLMINLLNVRLRFLTKHEPIKSEDNDLVTNKFTYNFAFGNQMLNIELINTEDKFVSLLTSIVKDRSGSYLTDDVTIPTLTLDQIKQLSNLVQNEVLFGNYQNSNSLREKISKLQNTVNNILTTISQEQKDNLEVDITALNFIKDILNSVLVLVTMTYKYDVLVARKILEYCEKSLTNY